MVRPIRRQHPAKVTRNASPARPRLTYIGCVPDVGDLRSCSFCGTSQQQVKTLIAGSHAHICDGCVRRVHEVIAGHGRSATTPIATIERVSDEVGAAPCGFCGKRRYQVAAMASAGDARTICDQCLDLCDEILRDETLGDEPPVFARNGVKPANKP